MLRRHLGTCREIDIEHVAGNMLPMFQLLLTVGDSEENITKEVMDTLLVSRTSPTVCLDVASVKPTRSVSPRNFDCETKAMESTGWDKHIKLEMYTPDLEEVRT